VSVGIVNEYTEGKCAELSNVTFEFDSPIIVPLYLKQFNRPNNNNNNNNNNARICNAWLYTGTL